MGSIKGVLKVAAARIGVTLDEYVRRVEGGEKWCYGCSSWLLAARFGADTNRGDGLSSLCLECKRLRYVKRKRGPSPLRGKAMSDTAKRKMSLAARGSRNHRWKGGDSRKRDPLKIKAKRAVNHAVEAGRLAHPTSLPCLDCGSDAHEYHHHRGYLQPSWLEVQAMCRKCHRVRHAVK